LGGASRKRDALVAGERDPANKREEDISELDDVIADYDEALHL
jgi:hypothetical protein